MPHLLLVATDPDLHARVGIPLEREGVSLTLLEMREGLAESVAADPPDAALLDLGLPDEQGWHLLRSLRQRFDPSSLPIVGLTSRDSAEECVRAFALGANDVLRRPFDSRELVLRVRGVIASLRDRSASLRGRLEVYPLAELLQSCERSGWSGCVQVFGGAGISRIHFHEGKVVGAEAGRLQGIEALWASLESVQGDFALTSGLSVPAGPPIVPTIRHLLIDVGWAAQEIKERSRYLPPPEAPISFASRSFSLPEALPRLPTQQILDLLERNGPMALSAVTAVTDAAPARTRLAVAALLEKGAVSAAWSGGGETGAPAGSRASDGVARQPVVALFYARAAHEGVRTFLASFPSPEVLPLSLAEEAVEKGARTVARQPGEDPIEIRYEPLALDSVAEMLQRAREATHVVLWLGPDLAAEGIPMPLQLLHTASRGAERLVLVTDSSAAGERMLADLEAGSRWRSAPANPRELTEILLGLRSSGPSAFEEPAAALVGAAG